MSTPEINAAFEEMDRVLREALRRNGMAGTPSGLDVLDAVQKLRAALDGDEDSSSANYADEVAPDEVCDRCDCDQVIGLGRLGRTDHYRCRACGWTFARKRIAQKGS